MNREVDLGNNHSHRKMPASLQSKSTHPSALPPFLLRPDDVATLSESDGFSILKEHLAAHYDYELCAKHRAVNAANLQPWFNVRDVIHALLVPVVELFDRATSLASLVTNATKPDDLEYAFTGQARSAFVWLQCFLSTETERAWCYTEGCPACIVKHSLDSEFTVRLMYAACLLSDVHYPFTLEGPTLPSFMFFLDSLEHALEQDPLFGPDFFEITKPKAEATRNGIEDLIHQCLELDADLSQPSSPESESPVSSRPTSPRLNPADEEPGMKVKRSKMARHQIRMQREEQKFREDMMRNESVVPKQETVIDVQEVTADN